MTLLGSTFKPIWFVGQEPINGINYLLICEANRSTLKGKKYIVGIIINIPSGSIGGEGAKIIEVIEDSDLIEGTDPEDKVHEYFEKIMEKAEDRLLGVGYTPIMYIGRKVTKGINHIIAAQARVIYPEAEPYPVLIEFNVFQDKPTLLSLEKMEE